MADSGNIGIVPGYSTFYAGTDPNDTDPKIDWNFVERDGQIRENESSKDLLITNGGTLLEDFMSILKKRESLIVGDFVSFTHNKSISTGDKGIQVAH